jgi:4-hydroxy-tetrahydrodipicolinate synthase
MATSNLMERLTGCGTALVTPFRNGRVDYQAYSRLVKRQVDAGINFLVPLGTSAEAPCLNLKEGLNLLQLTVEIADGLPLVVGAGNNSLTQTLENIRKFDGHGADAFLIVVPFYNKPTQEGLLKYFTAVADASSKPIVLYTIPGRTGTNMLAETTLRLAEHDNIIAIKEASGNYEQICEIVRNAPKGFKVFSGNDDETLKVAKIGADGIISVASNIAPKAMAKLISLIKQGDMDSAESLNEQLAPLFKNCFLESNPIPVKAGLASLGIISNELRLPLTPASQPVYDIMAETVKSLVDMHLI